MTTSHQVLSVKQPQPRVINRTMNHMEAGRSRVQIEDKLVSDYQLISKSDLEQEMQAANQPRKQTFLASAKGSVVHKNQVPPARRSDQLPAKSTVVNQLHAMQG